MEEKKIIRKQIFAKRKACSDQEIETWSREFTWRLTALPAFLEA